MDLTEIVDDKFKHNIKRSIFIKEIKKYDLEEFKIKQINGTYEIYVKKSNSKKKIKKIYEFVTYKNNNENIKKRKNIDEDLKKINKDLKIMKLI
jgi:hypothetical protein